MDTIKKLNPNHDRARIRRSGKSEGIIPIDLVHDHFQDYLKLLEKRKLKLMHTSSLDGNSGSISEVSYLKALMGYTSLTNKKMINAIKIPKPPVIKKIFRQPIETAMVVAKISPIIYPRGCVN
jgi:hypothetical protein